MKTQLTFKLERDTPGALVYHQVTQDGLSVSSGGKGDRAGLVGTLYLRKHHVGPSWPKDLKVTVEAS